MDNLENDMHNASWFVDKVIESDVYAQNLYAALCNNEFVNVRNTFDIIIQRGNWSCSWRAAGGIVSELRQCGDYLDWYCSGSQVDDGYVSEGIITPEIRGDLLRLGWIPVAT